MKKTEIFGTFILPFVFTVEGVSQKQAIEKFKRIITNWELQYNSEANIVTVDGAVHNIEINDVDMEIEEVVETRVRRAVVKISENIKEMPKATGE